MKKLLIVLLLTSLLSAQTYSVGDVVSNFGTSICANVDGQYWEYDVDGIEKITWINLFTTW